MVEQLEETADVDLFIQGTSVKPSSSKLLSMLSNSTTVEEGATGVKITQEAVPGAQKLACFIRTPRSRSI
ncbi:hypothetical protein N7519_009080 [Penicillium mononematosum]|uniref:uncharacterized protein n=1 Tax=Penicillium mononematosum TaxID=268346 RepID=UPI002546704D|nr:uncharacterized protein N7519_009080 [Penicillium mononematosum]KAJ6178619.1 hypothetical protein N7519_009080 [Penicillium mononematosum]